MDTSSQLAHLQEQACPASAVLRGPVRIGQGAAASFRPLAVGPARPAALPATGIVLHVGISAREWILAAPAAGAAGAAAASENVPQALALAVAGRIGDAGGDDAGLAVVRVRPSALAPEFGVILRHRPGRVVLYCTAAQVTEPGARVLSKLAGVIGVTEPGSGPQHVELELWDHRALLGDGLHPAAALGTSADGGSALVRARVCAGLLTGPAAEAIGRLWTAEAQLAARAC